MRKNLLNPSKIFIVISCAVFVLADLSTTYAQTSKKQVLKDFQNTHEISKGRKVLTTTYVGEPRKFTQIEGLVKVLYTAYKVAVVELFEDCGLKVEYTWEVWYRQDGRTWNFAQIAIWGHKPINEPTKPMPQIDDSTIKNLIKGKIQERSSHQTYKTKLEELSVLGKKSSWNFCTPVYQVLSKAKVVGGEETENAVDVWECTFASLIQQKDGKWENPSTDCFYEGKPQSCYYKTMCKNLGAKSKIETIQWAEAKPLIQKYLQSDIDNKPATFTKFDLIRQEETSQDGLDTWFVIDAIMDVTKKESSKETNWKEVDYIYTYDCKIFAGLGLHKYGSGKWEVNGSQCCSSADKKCSDGHCSDQRKCKVVKKVPKVPAPTNVLNKFKWGN